MKNNFIPKSLAIVVIFIFAGITLNAQITINELCPKDEVDPYFIDEEGGGTDWVELYNAGDEAVNVALMRITDDPTDPFADCEEIPDTDAAATTIEPGGFLMLICGAKDAAGDDVPTSIADGVIYIDMGIKASNEDDIVLYDTDETILDQSGDIPNEMEDEKSYGKTADGGDTWQEFDIPTPNASNGGVSVSPVTNKNVSIFPNPCNDVLNVVLNTSEKTNLSITDISGRIVYDNTSSETNIVVPTNKLSAGIYFLNITENKEFYTIKFIVQ